MHASAALRRTFPALRSIAILRNPRERTVSAFNDYVRVGRIRGTANASAAGMEALIGEKVEQVRSGARSLESFDVRILTSGVYIHGLRAWGDAWPAASLPTSLLVLRSEDLFDDTPGTMARVQAFLQLPAPFDPAALQRVRNRNTLPSKARPSRALNALLDGFFAPYNEELYAWLHARGRAWTRWPNASAAG